MSLATRCTHCGTIFKVVQEGTAFRVVTNQVTTSVGGQTVLLSVEVLVMAASYTGDDFFQQTTALYHYNLTGTLMSR